MGGAPKALGLGWGGGAVATNPWTGNGFWRTIGGGPYDVRLGWAWSVVLVLNLVSNGLFSAIHEGTLKGVVPIDLA